MLRLLTLVALLAAVAVPASAQTAFFTNDPTLCLALNGRNVVTRACSTSSNVWQATYYQRNAFVFRANNGCLDGYRGEGQPVEVVGCDGSLEQDWFINTTGQIQNKRHTNLCLDVEGGLGANRRVLGYRCDYNSNQSARAANQRFFLGTARTLRSGERAVSVPGLAGTAYTAPSTGGAMVVAAGGGNLVAAGGGNLVAAGGGNLVAAGGGN